MRRPQIAPGELLHDGGTATIVGAFFGDKKGALRLGYPEAGAGGEVVIEAGIHNTCATRADGGVVC